VRALAAEKLHEGGSLPGGRRAIEDNSAAAWQANQHWITALCVDSASLMQIRQLQRFQHSALAPLPTPIPARPPPVVSIEVCAEQRPPCALQLMRSLGYRQWEAAQYAVLTNELIASDKRTTDAVTYAEFVDIFMTEPEKGGTCVNTLHVCMSSGAITVAAWPHAREPAPSFCWASKAGRAAHIPPAEVPLLAFPGSQAPCARRPYGEVHAVSRGILQYNRNDNVRYMWLQHPASRLALMFW
jgi:hypothetical protein